MHFPCTDNQGSCFSMETLSCWLSVEHVKQNLLQVTTNEVVLQIVCKSVALKVLFQLKKKNCTVV